MFKEEGYKFMGAAFEVYNQLGYGMAEEVYQQCLESELQLRGTPFRSKHELRLIYKEHQIETVYKPDLFVYEGIVVELKAVTELTSDHEAQLFNDMRIARQSATCSTSATKANCNGNASSCPTFIRLRHKHEFWNANLH